MALEDFTTYTEVDTGNDRIQKTANHIDHLAYRNESTYLHKDYGAGHFGDFVHFIDVKCSMDQAYLHPSIWAVTNDNSSDLQTMYNANEGFLTVIFYKDGSYQYLLLREYKINVGGVTQDSWTAVLTNTQYYLRIERSGDTLTCGIWTNSTDRDNNDTGADSYKAGLSITLVSAVTTYQHLYAVSSFNTGHTYYGSTDVDNLDLNEVGGEAHYKTVTEILGLVDTKSRVKEIHRTATELLGLLDTKSFVKEIHRTVTELLGLKDVVDYTSTCGKTRQKVEINGVEVTNNCLSSLVTRRENAVATAVLVANDLEGETFLNSADVGNIVKVSYKLIGETAWTQSFEGYVVELNPKLGDNEICAIKCYGIGIALNRMRAKGEYGTESLENYARCTIRGILATDDAKGVLYGYVNRIMGGATASGYNIKNNYIDNDLTEFKYLLWKGVPVTKAIKDMADLITADKWDEEDKTGIHWQVLPDSEGNHYLCLGTIGKHDLATPNAFDSLWANNYAGGTLTVGTNIISSRFTKLPVEANYVLAYGKFQFPLKDKWTENNSDEWAIIDELEKTTLYDDDTIYKVDSYSIKAVAEMYGVPFWWKIYYDQDLNLDVDKIGSELNPPTLEFWIRKHNVETGIFGFVDDMQIRIYTGAIVNNDYFYVDLSSYVHEDEWKYLSMPIGRWATKPKWEENGSPDWTDVSYIVFAVKSHMTNATIWVDGLSIGGIIGRAAYNSTNITANLCKVKLMTDSLAKSDTLVASDDSGTFAQLVKAELLRCMGTPIIGEIVIDLDPDAMAGQLVHVANPRNANFPVDSGETYLTMRILEVKPSFSLNGQLTRLIVTSDITNSYPIQPANAYNLIKKAVKPDSDRESGDLVSKGIDVNVTILEKDYPS